MQWYELKQFGDETREDFLRGEAEEKLRAELKELSWAELIDLIPEAELEKIKNELIETIISEGWGDELL